jgi:hypothetical protein
VAPAAPKAPATTTSKPKKAVVRPVTPIRPAIEPEIGPILDRMGDFLGKLKAYAIHAETETDEVLLTGPKIQYGGTTDVVVRLPDRLHAVITRDDKPTQEFFYDGTALTVFLPAKNVWGSTPMPPTVQEMMAVLRTKYAAELPLDDLIRFAIGHDLLTSARAAVVVGTGRVSGAECDHLAAHYDDVDGQLWVEKGELPLPRKIVVTTLDDPAFPQHTEVLTWDLTPNADDVLFRFKPPAGAQRVAIAEPPPPKAAPAKAVPAAKKKSAK